MLRIGTSGFLYDHWRESFYPKGTRGHELDYYVAHFTTVELNVTFYRMPSAATFDRWADRAPADFVFAVKASRYLTHVRRLQDPRGPIESLLDRASRLGPHLGPILLQLPPDMPAAFDDLAAALEVFPPGIRVAVEPRHRSWFETPLRELLTAHGAALCLADRRGPVTPIWRTTDWTYVRFHGGGAQPRGCYGERALATWASRLRDGWSRAFEGYAYFNNDRRGCALRDASTFHRAVSELEVAASPVSPIGDALLSA